MISASEDHIETVGRAARDRLVASAVYGESVPAGGVIIGDFADPMTWLPRGLAQKALP